MAEKAPKDESLIGRTLDLSMKLAKWLIASIVTKV